MPQYKIIGADNNVYGPVSVEQLRQWIAEGRTNAQTQVQPDGAADWKPLSAFPEFADAFGLTASSPTTASTPPAVSVPNYLVQAILVTICCCLPLGIPAIVFAAQVNSKLLAGDMAGAQDASNKAKMWCWIGFGLGLAANLISTILLLVIFGIQLSELRRF